MCGICGFTGYRQDQKTVIERMMKAIEHRGPDSEGSFCREKITLGFRRLSIIDLEELTDKVRRQMAEFENFRKRSEKEKSQMYEVGAKSILEKILPVVDNFERGLKGMEESEDPFAQGMQMIYKQLMTSLEEAGVSPIEALGNEFDPNFHNAVMHVEDEEAGESEIVEEFQKGYMYHDTVLRHSMVKVAN